MGAGGEQRASKRRRQSGWAPYWLPMLAFLLTLELGKRGPDVAAPIFLVLRVAAPLGFLVYFLRRGAYPELRGARWGGWAVADVAVGLLGAALWMAPFLLFDSVRPDDPGFDPAQLGDRGVGLALFLRFAGYAGVTPFVEELFVRSWLLRYVDVFDTRRDFRNVPIARFTWRSFIVVMVYFVFSHVQWEWAVMAGWSLLTMGWFYYRGHLAPLVLVHAVTNGAILFAVVLGEGVFRDASGAPIPLWFFL